MNYFKPTRIVSIAVSDGVEIVAALYLPKGRGRYPTLLAASPYRFDNNAAPAVPVFLWRETGPIDWYVAQGYAFVHMDVRGTGRSGGEYRYQCKREQRDLYEVIEWIAAQAWSNGKVGGIGQSYYARMQWFMGTQNPPHLAGIAPYDGNIDTYRNSAYAGGIPGSFPSIWYEQNVRPLNQYPSQGPARMIDWDYPQAVCSHPTYDSFWRERAAAEHLEKIRVPVFSIGVWSKVDLHLNGNIVGFQRAGGPKKMLVFGSSNLFAAVANFSSVAFHETYLLPFYDWCLKGEDTSYPGEPDIRYFLTGAEKFLDAESWPPPGVSHRSYFLSPRKTGSVTSLNDGSLTTKASRARSSSTAFHYPDPGWRFGVVGFGKDGRPDPARRVLTFCSPTLEADLDVVGPIKLVLYAASSQPDTDFIVKLSEQMPQSKKDREKDVQPNSRVVTKGWLRASHRQVDVKRSLENAPWYTHTAPKKIRPGEIYEFDIAIMPTAYRFKKGSRIRLELANGDSQFTELVFHHPYTPDKVGQDDIHHSAAYPSRLILPILPSD
jgi:putative CocE/NonD family hydrolase